MKNSQIFKETIGDLLIAMLSSGRNPVAFRAIIRKRELSRYNKESVRVAMSRLNKKGYLINSKNIWKITEKGKIYAIKNKLFLYINSPFNDKDKPNTIVSFDIPGPKRDSRDWLRTQLKIFNYKMLQQSLWLGPGPLPREFLNRLNELEIRKNIKIFNVKKKIII